jgi:hypothetical protein
MRVSRTVLPVVLLFLAVLLSSCADNLPQDIPRTYTAPSEYTFTVPYEKAWKGAVRAISEENRVKILETESGLIVTEYSAVNKPMLSMLEGSPFVKVYKNSYSVNLNEVSPGQTTIRVQANLTIEQFAACNREGDVDWFEAALRQNLFRKICNNLYLDTMKCLTLFPDYHTVAFSCPEPQQTPQQAIAAVPPGEQKPAAPPAVKPPEISVRQVQQALVNAGYESGPIDGQMGAKTRLAILRFQKENGIDGQGYINSATLVALGL